MNRFTNKLTPSTAIALIALLVSLSGSAVAATLITGKQIKDGTIQQRDLSKKARASLKGPRGLQGPQGIQGAKGDKGDPGSPGAAGRDGADGAAGPAGSAKAYAFVDPSGPTITKSKNIVSVSRPFTGVYCLAVTGVDRATATYAAGVDFRNTGSGQGLASADSDATSAGCDGNGHPGEFEVVTHKITGAATAPTSSDVGFWVAVF